MNGTERQIEALASLQSAILSQEENLIETLEFVVKEAGDAESGPRKRTDTRKVQKLDRAENTGHRPTRSQSREDDVGR